MDLAEVDNDTRGWIMSIVSGLACIAGTSIICVDLVIRLIPSKRHFRIQDSNAFLSCALSLSFGVMIFSALSSMLPSSRRYLAEAGLEEQRAGLVLMACFIGGFVGIQAISRLFHLLMPSHVVDCDHNHGEHAEQDHASSDKHRSHKSHMSRRNPPSRPLSQHPSLTSRHPSLTGPDGSTTESTPLLLTASRQHEHLHSEPPARDRMPAADALAHSDGPAREAHDAAAKQGRTPVLRVQTSVMSFIRDTKANCDESGPCHGYSDPCGQGCFKHVGSRFSATPASRPQTAEGNPPARADHPGAGHHHDASGVSSQAPDDVEAQHHHHVPANAFLSIGLQTVIALTLHKFPEGFITYATNHANPGLGFNVFMALFVHNIADGFAMALPLYMAIGSRAKAVLWSSLLGGCSQPAGAAVAALWIKLAKHSDVAVDSLSNACLFAITSGIMTSVALQLFVEGMALNHNRNLNVLFAFLGMTLLGLSNTLVGH